MLKPSDLFLVIVGAFCVYRIKYGDGFTTVNCFILFCLVVAVISTALARAGVGRKIAEEGEEKAKDRAARGGKREEGKGKK